MTTTAYETAPIGEFVLAVFDNAALYSTDPREVSLLATRTIEHMLRHARWPSLLPATPKGPTPCCLR